MRSYVKGEFNVEISGSGPSTTKDRDNGPEFDRTNSLRLPPWYAKEEGREE